MTQAAPVTTLVERLTIVRARIAAAEQAAGRKPGSVRLLAVSKTHPPAALEAVHQAGQRCFGESYVQEAVAKIRVLSRLPLEWHFIGPIQSNKTQEIASGFAWVHSIDRLKIARRLSEQRDPTLPPLKVCLQINISGEETKSGASPAAAEALVKEIAHLPHLKLVGLMAIPAPAEQLARQRAPFRALRELRDQLVEATGIPLPELSMGMTDDLEAAIAEGATIVRVGTAIFGERPTR